MLDLSLIDLKDIYCTNEETPGRSSLSAKHSDVNPNLYSAHPEGPR